MDQTVKLQAYLDNEVTSADAREIAAWLARDADARQLLDELKVMRDLMTAGEVEVKVPDSREFYWSKIERAIAQAGPRPVPCAPAPWWARFLVPAAGLAAVTLLMVSTGTLDSLRLRKLAANVLEVDASEPADDSGAITFHSNREGTTVVWIPSGR